MGKRNFYAGVSHGTLGELFQGPFIKNDELNISIISLPLKKFSWTYYMIGAEGNIKVEFSEKNKTRKAIELYLSHYGKSLPPGKWTFNTELKTGTGMSSSTADIVSAIRCLDAIFSQSSSEALLASILREIERSDSVFLNHYAIYLSHRQEVVHHFTSNPQLYACYIDEGNSVETEQSTQKLISHYERRLPAYLKNIDKTFNAFTCADLKQICHCSTESALLSQDVFPKQNFDVLISQQKKYKADGIVIAYTGSLLGYLFVREPTPSEMGELSSFFFSLRYQCHFVRTGIF